MGRRSAIPRWFPLYLLFVLAVTLSPFAGHCVRQSMGVGAPNPVDVLQNLLLFVPFGWALAALPRSLLVALALLLSGTIETLQLWLPRSPSVWDIAANGAGSLFGAVLAVRAPSIRILGSRPILSGLTLLLLGGMLLSVPALRANDFSNWEPFPLVVGNEANGERPWLGTLHEVAIFDRGLVGAAPPLDRPWSEGGPILHGRFVEETLRLDGPSGSSASALPPRPAGPAPWYLPDVATRHVRSHLADTSRMSVWLRFTPGDPTDTGPGRILSQSVDTGHRNFTVGQYRQEIVFRVRTPTTGENGNQPEVRTRGASLTAGQHVVLASFEGWRSRILVDGACRGEASIGVRRGSFLLGVALPGCLVACMGLVALTTASWVPAGRAPRAALCVAGLATWAGLYGIGTWSHFPDFDGPALALGVAALGAAWLAHED